VNFAAADTGTLWLVENEGNGRLSTTVPDTHIAIMGIEKVVEKLEHIVPLASLLTRSATGQAITTYFNLISGPRRAANATARASCIWCCSTTAARRPTPTSSCARRCSASAAARA
jgi:L-lactate utilization protein LutB